MPKKKTFDDNDYVRLFEAYVAVTENGMKLKAASKKYGIPQNVLHDRITGKVPLESMNLGPDMIISEKQERLLSKHLKKLISFGYHFKRKDICILASEYAFDLGLRRRDKPLGPSWFNSFSQRHPEVIKLNFEAKSADVTDACSESTIQVYFENLKMALEKYNLFVNPHHIYNIDEKALTSNYTPPNVVNSSNQVKKSFTTPSNETEMVTTLFAAGNAIGNHVPPYFVFKGENFDPNFIVDGSPRVGGTVSSNGFSNVEVFKKYLTEHFLHFVPQGKPSQPLMIIYQGYKSYLTPSIVEWFEKKNIVLFILPAHTSHILQPLEVTCFKTLDSAFTASKHRMTQCQNTQTLSHSEICKVACEAYLEAMQPKNLFKGFKKTGISPFGGMEVIDKRFFAPFETCPTPPSTEDYDSSPQVEERNCKRNATEIDDEYQDLASSSDKVSSKTDFSSPKVKKQKLDPDSVCCQCLQKAPPAYSEDDSDVDWLEGSFVVDWIKCSQCDHQVHSGICVPDTDDFVNFVCPCCDAS